MDLPNLTQWIAGYAALVSTAVAARTFWIERDRLKVSLTIGVRDTIKGVAAVIEIRNHGRRAAYVNSVGLVVQYEAAGFRERFSHAVKYRTLRAKTVGWVHIPAPTWADKHTFPTAIQPGESMMLWLPATELAGRESQLFVAEVQDGLRRRTFSNRFRLQPLSVTLVSDKC